MMHLKHLITLQSKNPKYLKLRIFLNSLLRKHHIKTSTVKLFVNDNTYINGYASSNPFTKNFVLMLTKGDVKKLSYEENCTLLAHEVGHILYDDAFYAIFITCVITILEIIFIVDDNIFNNVSSNHVFELIALLLCIALFQENIIFAINNYRSEYLADKFACKSRGKHKFKDLILKIHIIDASSIKNLKQKISHLKLTPIAYLHCKFLLFYAKYADKLDLIHASWRRRLHRLNIKV